MGKRIPMVSRIATERETIRRRLKMLNPRGIANGGSQEWGSRGGDPEAALEQAQQELLKEEDLRVYARVASQAKALEEAWNSLQQGSYGICRECGQHIPRRRLNAVPGAAFCVPCQEQREAVSSC